MHISHRHGFVVAVFLSVFGPALAAGTDMEEILAATYDEFSMSPPTPASVLVCHGFGCKFRTEVALTDADRATLTQLLAPGKVSAASERRAIGNAGAWFDRRIGAEAGTRGHVARASVAHMFSDGQFDCIDSSRNMTSLLLILDQLKLLHHHAVDVPKSRGLFVDGRGLHVTAVLSEKALGKKWAVDSWTRGYGQAPEIIPLALWMRSN